MYITFFWVYYYFLIIILWAAAVFVHEWGHLRWGLFDEYPSTTDPQFYVSSSGVAEGTRCSAAITGEIASSRQDTNQSTCHVPEGELPPSHCYFRPNGECQPDCFRVAHVQHHDIFCKCIKNTNYTGWPKKNATILIRYFNDTLD